MPENWITDAPPAEDITEESEQKAVAVRYDVTKDRAPRITAKGRSLVADRILAEAKKNGIPVYQNKSLVNMLMALEIDREIPPELYRTIAEVLAHVYRIDRHMGDRRSST
ncbi:EscU/YscU/HrcU family type III secretion system export apparatus switch protein [Selenomonas sp. F0473]|uniref:EscU/YscU/HrcU family type III secretion system export apparatus switch protein n=1 Tax=Selenomonas sp. F0473 TaxID=999423 RepID=UPI0025EAD1F3|nr:EscU/YscU/HrcU family type III secretion system export apparatus switch protein [Selenomonas sp. F0473]